MNKYIPKMYKKSILDINYNLLKKNNIKCLLFDLDNTLLDVHNLVPKKEFCYLIKKIKKEFKIVITSNNGSKKRLTNVAKELDVDFVRFALKPFSRGFRKVKKRYNLSKSEMCIIGDQIMTDILGGNKYGIYTVLVDPLSDKELKITNINRFFERRVLKKLDKKGLFRRGEYYE